MADECGVLIEHLLDQEDWEGARAVIRQELRADPDSHWLWARLSTTYHEQRRYRRSLRYVERALALALDCPLALWDYAGTLDMLGRKKEALKAYKDLIARGLQARAVDECWEGARWTRSLVNDCRYRIALIYQDLRKPAEALRSMKEYLAQRGPATPSIYGLREVRGKLAQLESCA